MSVSSATTLISPATYHRSSAASAGPSTTHAKSNHHAHQTHHTHGHGHTAHHAKRKGSTHSAAHPGPTRRSSDGQDGRRAVTAGLSMLTLDPSTKPHRHNSDERQVQSASRSDTNLPRLSRTTSITSNPSDNSAASVSHPRPDVRPRKQSSNSMHVLSEDGSEAINVESEGEEWESGDESIVLQKGKGKQRSGTSTPKPGAVNTTQSETKATEIIFGAKRKVNGLSRSPLPSSHDGPHHLALKQRTTGFAGSYHAPDPETAAQMLHHDVNHHWTDSTHIMPAHQIKHQQSAKSLASLRDADTSGGLPYRTLSGGSQMSRSQSKKNDSGDQSRLRLTDVTAEPETPVEQQLRTNSAQGDGTGGTKLPISPAFPFPKQSGQSSQLSQSTIPPTDKSGENSPPVKETNMDQPSAARAQAEQKPSPRRRVVSAYQPSLRHRLSHSSLRSVQSLRAPPHPLNSPTGYRSGLLPSSSRPGSNLSSPQKDRSRGPSLHQPPIAPPMVHKQTVEGTTWDIAEDEEVGELSVARPESGSDRSATRETSFASIRSVSQGANTRKNSASTSATHSQNNNTIPRVRHRQTALEAASAAAKMNSTADPALYHQSLGYPASSAETAHFISRFLPTKKTRRPAWEISPETMQGGQSAIGLTNGDFRDAHESLIRSIRAMGTTPSSSTRRNVSRSHSSYLLLAPVTSQIGAMTTVKESEIVGSLNGKNGLMVVARGGWQGKTPFELSVERCLAQRPQRSLAGL